MDAFDWNRMKLIDKDCFSTVLFSSIFMPECVLVIYYVCLLWDFLVSGSPFVTHFLLGVQILCLEILQEAPLFGHCFLDFWLVFHFVEEPVDVDLEFAAVSLVDQGVEQVLVVDGPVVVVAALVVDEH